MFMGPRQCCCVCPNGWPSMLLTVTGTTGTITWCGETWVLPADSGQTREVCPTAYGIGASTTSTPYPTYTQIAYFYGAFHFWDYSSQLNLDHKYRGVVFKSTPGGTPVYGARRPDSTYGWGPNRKQLTLFGTLSDNFGFYHIGTARPLTPAPFSSVAAYASSIGQLVNTNAYTYSSYKLGTQFFGSYTTGGVTYTWAKGSNWP